MRAHVGWGRRARPSTRLPGRRIMKVTLSTEALTEVKVDLLAVGVRAGALTTDPRFKALDKASGGALKAQAALEDFEGKSGQVLKTALSGVGATQVLVLGLGDGKQPAADARALAVKAAQVGTAYK